MAQVILFDFISNNINTCNYLYRANNFSFNILLNIFN